MCSDLFGNLVPPYDSFAVRRLRDAGFVIVGKTALPEMAILPTTESRRNGPTRNPWSLDRTPGGSSGGSAAAVAAGMVPIAHGSDGGGSIRIPAACCGLVGLKPARGRISQGPELGQSFLSTDGVLTRTTADTAAALDVLAGYEQGDANWAPPPTTPYAELATPDRLKIGVTLEPGLAGVAVDPVCAQAVRDAAELLSSLGHELHEVSAPWTGMDLLPDFTRAFGPMVSMATFAGGRIAGREPTETDVEPLTWTLWRHALEVSSVDFQASLTRLERAARTIVGWIEPLDAVLMPALAQRPVPIGQINGTGDDPWAHYRRSSEFTPFTAIFNASGLPAISVPLYHGDDSLPTAVQLAAGPASEHVLLGLAGQLEQALPWSDRLPDPEHGAHRAGHDA